MSERKKIICLDFDGVLHSYTSGWQGADCIPDPPVPGALEFLCELLVQEDMRVCIYSSRNHQPDGVDAMQAWLLRNGITEEEVAAIDFPNNKPPAHLTIDDRAVQFRGTFPTVSEARSFTPWRTICGVLERRRRCKVCKKWLYVAANGGLHVHGPHDSRCPGSGAKVE